MHAGYTDNIQTCIYKNTCKDISDMHTYKHMQRHTKAYLHTNTHSDTQIHAETHMDTCTQKYTDTHRHRHTHVFDNFTIPRNTD